jgi:hypothetical protein
VVAGQPVRIELGITLDELANAGVGSPAGPGSTCDAVIRPVITGLPPELGHVSAARVSAAR